MQEKKLNDEEIIKAVENCLNGDYKTKCNGCHYAKSKGYCQDMDRDALDLIHRLKSENKKLKDEKKNYEHILESALKNETAFMTSPIGDLPINTDGMRKAIDCIAEQKAEIERLTKKAERVAFCEKDYLEWVTGFLRTRFDIKDWFTNPEYQRTPCTYEFFANTLWMKIEGAMKWLIELEEQNDELRQEKSEMIEKKIDESHTVTVVEHLIEGNKTIVKLSNEKVGIAECSPDDEFDEYEGLRIATARAYGKEPFPKAEEKKNPKNEPFKVGERVQFKTMTDEEIVKFLEDYIREGYTNAPAEVWLDSMRRLQRENAEQKAEIERLKKFELYRIKAMKEYKEEIEQLTEVNAKIIASKDDMKRKCEADLEYYKGLVFSEKESAFWDGVNEGKSKAVKETAKEIMQLLKDGVRYGWTKCLDITYEEIKERYGVEMEE